MKSNNTQYDRNTSKNKNMNHNSLRKIGD